MAVMLSITGNTQHVISRTYALHAANTINPWLPSAMPIIGFARFHLATINDTASLLAQHQPTQGETKCRTTSPNI
ncbi:hypothetical protein EMIT0P253_10537 [Pseudomonas sp. IT-P253]